MKFLLNMRFRTVLYFIGSIMIFYLMVQILIQIYNETAFGSEILDITDFKFNYNASIQEVNDPIILWWTPFTGQLGLLRQCGAVKCFFTEDRRFRSHVQTKALMFYGSKFDLVDIPLPRDGLNYDWALLHEESPKNTPALSHFEALQLFNITSTFSRHSHSPLTLQYLKSENAITGLQYFVPLDMKDAMLTELAPVLYIHSDCNTPLERDAYVTELMKYIRIDSYGKCLQNKQLPEHLSDPMKSMDSDDFFHFVARYKFTLSFENAVCEDYITEKLWRPLIVGSVPIYMGSPSVRDWLPNNKSAIIAADFKSPSELAEYILSLNGNVEEYKTFLQHKFADGQNRITNEQLLNAIQTRKWGIDNDFEKGNFIEHFECFVCQEEHTKLATGKLHSTAVNIDHYNCPIPLSPLTGSANNKNWWVDQWHMGKCEAKVLRIFIELGRTEYSHQDFYEEVKNMFHHKNC